MCDGHGLLVTPKTHPGPKNTHTHKAAESVLSDLCMYVFSSFFSRRMDVPFFPPSSFFWGGEGEEEEEEEEKEKEEGEQEQIQKEQEHFKDRDRDQKSGMWWRIFFSRVCGSLEVGKYIKVAGAFKRKREQKLLHHRVADSTGMNERKDVYHGRLHERGYSGLW